MDQIQRNIQKCSYMFELHLSGSKFNGYWQYVVMQKWNWHIKQWLWCLRELIGTVQGCCDFCLVPLWCHFLSASCSCLQHTCTFHHSWDPRRIVFHVSGWFEFKLLCYSAYYSICVYPLFLFVFLLLDDIRAFPLMHLQWLSVPAVVFEVFPAWAVILTSYGCVLSFVVLCEDFQLVYCLSSYISGPILPLVFTLNSIVVK